MVRILFYGTPTFAVPTLTRLLGSSYQVVGVVTQPDRKRGRRQKILPSPVKMAAMAHEIPVLQPEGSELKQRSFLTDLDLLQPDLAVVVAYGNMLPRSALDAPQYGTINVHASLLPKYRGAAPIHRAIIAGEPETGVTIIRLVQQMDAGPILAQSSSPIGPNDTSSEVEGTLSKVGAELLLKTVVALFNGTAREQIQDHSTASYAARITKSEGCIDWRLPAPDLHNLIRGLHPWPLAFSYSEGKRYVIHRTKITNTSFSGSEPGTIVKAERDRLIVTTGKDSALEITTIQPEGGRPLDAQSFLAGKRWTVGRRFDSAPS